VLFGDGFPIRVVRNFGWADSLEPADVVPQFAATAPDAPFILHITSSDASEIKRKLADLLQLGMVTDRTVIIHRGALDQELADLLHRAGASQVWCPSSLRDGDSTIDAAFVVSNHRVALGTGFRQERSLDIFEEIQNALALGVPAAAIYSMVTSRPCSILRLKNGEGRIVAGTPADMLAVRHLGGTPAETLCSADAPSLQAVLLAGRPIVMTEEIAQRGPQEWRGGMEAILFDGNQRWVRWQLQRLVRNLVDRFGSPRIAGKTLTI
ncbi:MAG: amidohydrolase family protein, partial [Terriglobales bacterium]